MKDVVALRIPCRIILVTFVVYVIVRCDMLSSN
jgi:Flp pilus assembly protein protease CpaA